MSTPGAGQRWRKRARLAWYVLRHFGPRIVWLRLRVYASNWLGTTRRRFAPRAWEDVCLEQIVGPAGRDAESYAALKRSQNLKFLFPLGRPPRVPSWEDAAAACRRPGLPERLDLLEAGRCVYFFHTPSPEPIDWHRNPLDDTEADPEKTWSEIPDYRPDQGDPRMLWEPSRAAWAIDLARARTRGFDADRLAALYWRWVDDWMEHNPPFRGFQWKCGQESAVRLIAVIIGFWALADRPAFGPERWMQLARLAWATGYRIDHHIGYAISQKNNHAISEACALMLIAHLFPEFREADRWRRRGRSVLAGELKRQIYPDGSYCQQSTNYQRVMMQGATLALRLAELADDPLPRDLYDLLDRCNAFVDQLIDEPSGRVPQYGNNDGAWILPLDECDFWDFRPLVQSVHYLVHRARRLPAGPWDEDAIWLFGAEAATAEGPGSPPPRRGSRFDAGGYYTLRTAESWAMIRCHRYRDRVGHSDPLHLELWWRGRNLLRDCGTYRYYIPGRPDMEDYFTGIRSHSTVEVDGSDPMPRYSRFQRFPLTRATVGRFEPSADGGVLECRFHGYERRPWRVAVRRTVAALPNDGWLIVDDLLGEGEHTATLRWHLADGPCEVDPSGGTAALTLDGASVGIAAAATPALARFEVVRGRDEPGEVQGFASTHYGVKAAIPVIEARVAGPLPFRLATLISPGGPANLALEPPRDGVQPVRLERAGVRSEVALADVAQRGGPVFRHLRVE